MTVEAGLQPVPTQDPMVPQMYRVSSAHRETHDTVTIELDASSHPLPFAPGQFNMLYAFGVGEVPISISGDPDNPERLVHTIRDVGAVSRALSRVTPGDVIGVRGPYGRPWPIDWMQGRDVVITTGGIGLAPLRPAIYHILNHREQYGQVVVLYGARTPTDMLYVDELHAWRGRFDVEVEVTVDSAGTDWHGEVGVVTALIPWAKLEYSKTVALVCGPEIMMRFTLKELEKIGIGPRNVFVSMERNMKCAVGFCGHCQYGPHFVCKDGPVFRFDKVSSLFGIREL